MTLKAIISCLDGVLVHSTISEYVMLCRQLAAEYVDPQVMEATRVAMMKLADSRRDPLLDNFTQLNKSLSCFLGVTRDEIGKINERFYREKFPKLEKLSYQVGTVPDLLSVIQEHSLLSAVLPDVRYPEQANLQRLLWADLAVDDWDFIAHSENVHFDQGSPELFAEIVARLGVEPDETLVVTESNSQEMKAAFTAGLHVVEVIPASTHSNGLMSGGNTLSDLVSSLKTDGVNHWPSRALNRGQVMAELRGNLGALYGMLADVKPEQWHQHPWEEEWSITQILCHLLEREKIEQYPRLQEIAKENEPFIVAPPPPPGPEVAPCMNDGFQVAHQFKAVRLETLAFLESLEVELWQKPARHSIFGPTTLLEMAHFTAQHDRLHLNQLCQTQGRCD